MKKPIIIIASPNPRNDALEERLRDRLSSYDVRRVRDKRGLTLEILLELKPLFIFFPHWSWLVPATIFQRFDCIVFHMTDVPYGRGGSPLQNLIVRGHRETMLTALQCVTEVDAGPIYMKRPLSLTGTAEEILTRASVLIEDMVTEIVEKRPEPVPQQGTVVEFKRREPKDGDLSQLSELRAAYDYIRMLDATGYPSAFVQTDHFTFEFHDAKLVMDSVEARVRIKLRNVVRSEKNE